MMKVRVKDKYLNVRVGEPSVNAPCYQYIAPGSELEVDGRLYKGDKYGDSNIDTWFKDEAGNYYWSGGVQYDNISIDEVLKNSNPIDLVQGFNWFNQLKIKNIWEQFKEKGDNVKVAVLDTGYKFSNEDLDNKIKKSRVFLTKEKYPGIELIIDDQSNDGHGNRCTSIIGARNSKGFLIGIAPECEILNGKISINKELRDFNYIVEGIKWAISQSVDVISISYAYEDLTQSQISTINRELTQLVAGKEVLIFCSAGNSGIPQKTADLYPASFDVCISVGASNSQNQISSLTVLSNRTTIHAPGENIESYNSVNAPTPLSGTSFATPIVAGISALAISFLKKRDKAWNKNDLIKKLYDSGDIIQGTNGKRTINPTLFFKTL